MRNELELSKKCQTQGQRLKGGSCWCRDGMARHGTGGALDSPLPPPFALKVGKSR